MKPLSHHFRNSGFACRVLQRVADVVLIAKRAPRHRYDSFEICIVRRCPARVIAGHEIPAHESLPSPEHWGTRAWTETDLARALARFTQLVEQRRHRHAPAIATPAPWATSELAARVTAAAPLLNSVKVNIVKPNYEHTKHD